MHLGRSTIAGGAEDGGDRRFVLFVRRMDDHRTLSPRPLDDGEQLRPAVEAVEIVEEQGVGAQRIDDGVEVVAGVVDAVLLHVEPDALRDEIATHVAALSKLIQLASLTSTPSHPFS
jgi:hypothetical protein